MQQVSLSIQDRCLRPRALEAFGACSALWVCTLEFCDVTTGEREDLGRELELP